MKNTFGFLLAACLMLTEQVKAAIVTITVTNFQFTPSNTTVVVGDIVRFSFQSGTHNARRISEVKPSGAADINSGSPSSVVRTYDYPVSFAGTYGYHCEQHGLGMSGSFTASASMPVSLNSFFVTLSNHKNPVLKWKTLTELNVDYFSVQRSTDLVQFEEVDKITGMGNSNTEKSYTYTDKSSPSNIRYLYYELMIVDRDGKQTFSPIKMVKTGFASSKLIMKLKPNPIKKPDQLEFQFNAENEGKLAVDVFDLNGKQVIKTTMQAFHGLNNGHLHVCDLPSGTYTINFKYEGLSETKKVIVN